MMHFVAKQTLNALHIPLPAQWLAIQRSHARRRPCVDVTSCSHEMLSSAVHKLTAVSLQEAYYYCV